MTMELWRSDYPLWYNSFDWIVLPWLPICQGKDSGLSPRYAPPWCMAMRGSDHAPPPSWTECLTALSNKLHSRQLAEISWKGELIIKSACNGLKNAVTLFSFYLARHITSQILASCVDHTTLKRAEPMCNHHQWGAISAVIDNWCCMILGEWFMFPLKITILLIIRQQCFPEKPRLKYKICEYVKLSIL